MATPLRPIPWYAACLVILISGCSPVTNHEIFTTLVDGCPSLPPPAQFCADYATKTAEVAKAEGEGRKGGAGQREVGSQHQPYQDKRCDDCHDKSTESGFVAPKKELCFVCHTGFVKGGTVHGPVAVGECLACHEPHTAENARLLKKAVSELCSGCHREKRQAQGLHETVAARDITCVKCHDPHFGNVQYFLK